MRSNREFRALAWDRLWRGKWFWRSVGGSLLLQFSGRGILSVVSGILAALGVQTWQDYAEAWMRNRQDVTVPIPNLTSEYISQATSSTCLLLFFSYIMAGIAAYGCAMILLKCLKDDGEGWLLAAFDGFRCPFGLLAMILLRVLIYLGWWLCVGVPAYAILCAVRHGGLVGVSGVHLGELAMAGVAAAVALVVPHYRYRFVFLVRAENPNWSPVRCYSFCKRLMKGNMLKSFWLDLSYWRSIAACLMALCMFAACACVGMYVKPLMPFAVFLAIPSFGLLAIFCLVFMVYDSVGQGFLYRELRDAQAAAEPPEAA